MHLTRDSLPTSLMTDLLTVLRQTTNQPPTDTLVSVLRSSDHSRGRPATHLAIRETRIFHHRPGPTVGMSKATSVSSIPSFSVAVIPRERRTQSARGIRGISLAWRRGDPSANLGMTFDLKKPGAT